MLENQNGINSSHHESPAQPVTRQQKIWEVANGPEQINEVSPEQEEAESTEVYNRQGGGNTEHTSNNNQSSQKG